MSESQLNNAYLKVLQERYKYFQSKSITELSRDEIQEYLNLRDEVAKEFKEVKSVVTKVWNGIAEAIRETPEFQAQVKYQERVLNRSESNE